MTANTDHPAPQRGATVGGSTRAMKEIAALARSSSSEVHYFRELLPILGSELGAFYAGVSLQLPTEVWDHNWSDESVPGNFWRPAVDAALTETLSDTGPHARLYRTRNSDERVATLTAILKDIRGSRIGAVAILVRAEQETLASQLQRIQELVAFACECAGFVESNRTEVPNVADDPVTRAIQRSSGYESSMELAYAITNQIQSKSGADVVALGEVRGHKIIVRVISGQDEVRNNAPGVMRIRQALEECLDRAEPIVCQNTSDDAPEGTSEDHRLHRQWHESAGGDAVVSFPLIVAGKVKYVIGLRRGGSPGFRTHEIDKLRELVEPYAPALELLRRANRRLASHVADSVHKHYFSLSGPGEVGRKIFASLLAIAFGWFLLGSMTYDITVPARVLPAESRTFSAPEDAILSAVHVQPGDRVEKGQLLCEFDDRALRLEEQRLNAEQRAYSIELSQALAQEDRVGVSIARTKLDEIHSLLELNALRLSLTTLSAPFAGEITGGHLRERVGDRVVKGETLFQVASDGGWRLELLVPETKFDGIDRGLHGSFAAFARPEEEQSLALSEIAPSTSAEGGKNVFKVRADLAQHPDWLRAGMEGVARVDVGRRRVSWVMLHGVFDWFHLKYWF